MWRQAAHQIGLNGSGCLAWSSWCTYWLLNCHPQMVAVSVQQSSIICFKNWRCLVIIGWHQEGDCVCCCHWFGQYVLKTRQAFASAAVDAQTMELTMVLADMYPSWRYPRLSLHSAGGRKPVISPKDTSVHYHYCATTTVFTTSTLISVCFFHCCWLDWGCGVVEQLIRILIIGRQPDSIVIWVIDDDDHHHYDRHEVLFLYWTWVIQTNWWWAI